MYDVTSEKTPLFVCRFAQKMFSFPLLSHPKILTTCHVSSVSSVSFPWEVTPSNVWSSETVSNFAKVFGDEANPQSRPLVFENGEKTRRFFKGNG